MRIRFSNQSGLVLLEWMIILVIAGILLAIAIPQYQEYTQRASVQENDLRYDEHDCDHYYQKALEFGQKADGDYKYPVYEQIFATKSAAFSLLYQNCLQKERNQKAE